MNDSTTARRLREWADLADASVPDSVVDRDGDRTATTE
jgi:hypothetical protein